MRAGVLARARTCVSDDLDALYLAATVLSRVVFFFQAEDGIRDGTVTGVQTCALPICVLDIGLCATKGVFANKDARQAIQYAIDRDAINQGAYSSNATPWQTVFGPTSTRSEERRVGKECRSRWWPYH